MAHVWASETVTTKAQGRERRKAPMMALQWESVSEDSSGTTAVVSEQGKAE